MSMARYISMAVESSGGPAPAGRSQHRACRGRGGSGPGAGACRVRRPGRGPGGSGRQRAHFQGNGWVCANHPPEARRNNSRSIISPSSGRSTGRSSRPDNTWHTQFQGPHGLCGRHQQRHSLTNRSAKIFQYTRMPFPCSSHRYLSHYAGWPGKQFRCGAAEDRRIKGILKPGECACSSTSVPFSPTISRRFVPGASPVLATNTPLEPLG